jgi:hypothetical protein
MILAEPPLAALLFAGLPGMIPFKNNNGSSYAEGMPPDGRL